MAAVGEVDARVPLHELRVVMGGSKDDVLIADAPLTNARRSAIGLTTWGIGETLTRVSGDGTVVPWLAESVRNVDPLTWRVVVRHDARFCDGTPVSAAAVAASFAQNLEQQPDVAVLIDPATRPRVIDDSTLEFTTPRPCGNFAHALAHPQLIVHAAEGTLHPAGLDPLHHPFHLQVLLDEPVDLDDRGARARRDPLLARAA